MVIAMQVNSSKDVLSTSPLIKRAELGSPKLRTAEAKSIDLPCVLNFWDKMIQSHLENLKSDFELLKHKATEKWHIDVQCRFLKEVQSLQKVIEADERLLFVLKKGLEDLLHKAERLQKMLKSLEGEFKARVEVAFNQYDTEQDGCAFFPCQRHLSRNEDAFKHDKNVTVVADGLGGHLFSEGASRLVVKEMHKKVSEIVEKYSKKKWEKEILQEELVLACFNTEAVLMKQMVGLDSGTTCAVEMRILDHKENRHRFYIFLGDANCLYKGKDDEPILLNPLCYSSYQSDRVSYTKSREGIPVLSYEDIQELDQSSDNMRDFRYSYGSFLADRVMKLGPREMGMVYLPPTKLGETILMTDGITDRAIPKDITDLTPHKIFLIEAMIYRFRNNRTLFRKKYEEISSMVRFLENPSHKSYSLSKIKKLRIFELNILKECKSRIGKFADGYSEFSIQIQPYIFSFLRNVEWPDTDLVLNQLCEHLYYSVTFEIANLSSFDYQRLEENRAILVESILSDQFKLVELGFQSPLKFSDDSTYVSTTANDTFTKDLETMQTLPFLTRELVEKGGELTEASFIDLISKIQSEYNRAKSYVKLRGGRSLIYKTEKHIHCKVLEAFYRNKSLFKLYLSLDDKLPSKVFLSEELKLSMVIKMVPE